MIILFLLRIFFIQMKSKIKKNKINNTKNIEMPISLTRNENSLSTGMSEDDVNITAAGRERIKNIKSSTLVRVMREAALPAGMPLSINMASFTYPPPNAVGLTAAPRSQPTMILNISRVGSCVLKNFVQSLSRMLLVIQGTRARETANKRYSKGNSFKTRKIPLSVFTREKIIFAITPRGIRKKKDF